MKKFDISRRSFVALAALGCAVAPSVSFAQDKAEEKPAEKVEAADFVGKWALVAGESDDPEAQEMFALLAMFSSVTLELFEDGTCVETTVDMFDEEAEPEVEEGTWSLTEDGKIAVVDADDDDDDATVYELDGLSLVLPYEEDDVEGKLVFARPQDVLSGDWAVAKNPEMYDMEREGLVGGWSMVAIAGNDEDEVVDAAYCAMICASGMSMTVDIADDGTAVMTMVEDPEYDPEVRELNWELDGENPVFSLDGDSLAATLEDGKIVLDMDGMRAVFAPVA